jgi:hypothetical protein
MTQINKTIFTFYFSLPVKALANAESIIVRGSDVVLPRAERR